MNDIIRPGVGILFMKVGTHAQEPLDDIITRKTKEIDETGYSLWGYGGSTCHPQTMVQPFAKAFERKGQVIYLCMHPMKSSHAADPIRADEFSPDAIKWEPVPDTINVLGSRYALVLKSLERADFELPLDQTRVAFGRSEGVLGARYIRGRVDKACLTVRDHREPLNSVENPTIPIGLVAVLKPPYAVYLRNKT